MSSQNPTNPLFGREKEVTWCGRIVLSFYYCLEVHFLPLHYKGIKDKAVQLRDFRIGISDSKWVSLLIANMR